MRCVNCGYDNGPGYSACIKCGQPLKAFEQTSYHQHQAPQREMLEGTVIGRPIERNMPRPTVVGVSPNQLQERETVVLQAGGGQKTQLISPTPCHQCGYPIVANHTVCPHCGVALNAKKESSIKDEKMVVATNTMSLNGTFKCQYCQKEIPLTSTNCPSCGQRVHAPTISPEQLAQMMNNVNNVPRCSLTMLPEGNEVLDKPKNEYSGESVVLNRYNTEDNNPTITTQQQAGLVFENGEWYIQNLSERQTTYLILNRKIQLEEGDIIVMGNRRFKFEKK
jgi:hypothetical protein